MKETQSLGKIKALTVLDLKQALRPQSSLGRRQLRVSRAPGMAWSPMSTSDVAKEDDGAAWWGQCPPSRVSELLQSNGPTSILPISMWKC